MTLHDPSARLGYEKKTRRFRLPGLLWLRRQRGDAAGPGALVRVRDRRKLAAIDRRLAADAPALASMFAMFNGLAKAEGSVGAERLSPRAWPRPRGVHVALLLTLAAVTALFVALGTHIHPAMRPCPTAPAVASAVTQPVHATSCSAYATYAGK